MKLSGNRLRMSDGSVRNFKSGGARDRFERVAQAIKHGWKKPKRNAYRDAIKRNT